MLRGHAAIVNELIQIYPRVVVIERLAQVYQTQIKLVLKERRSFMRERRAHATPEVYDREQAELQRLEVWLSTGPKNIYVLERLLKYLLERQRALADLSDS